MPGRVDEDVRLPSGVMVRIRAPDRADRTEIEALARAAGTVRVGRPVDAAEVVLVAKQAWTGEVIGWASWWRAAGLRATAAVTVAHEYRRTPLAAHLLVRLARLADEALMPALMLGPLDAAEPSERLVREVFGMGDAHVELRTEDWPEALARVERIDVAAAHGSPVRAHGAGVVIAGGGVAALECLMALRDLAGPGPAIRLLAPEDEFVYRPLAVAEPFSLGHARRYPLSAVAADFGAELLRGAAVEVRPNTRELITREGAALSYEALVLAPGARPVAAYPHAITFGEPGAHDALRALLDDVDGTHVAFLAPGRTSWTLPLYELALMTAHEARATRRIADARFSLVTPEPRPLAVFGAPVSAQIGELLEAAGIDFIGSSYPDPRDGAVVLQPGGQVLDVDMAVALPKLRGPAIAGVPADTDGFLPTDAHGRVDGLDGVFAAGDATTYPIKQGGLAAQQADAVAEAVAAELGAPVRPRPFKPVLRGLLYTGGGDRFLRAGIGGGEGDGTTAPSALWWPPTKVAGLYLAPYLFDRDRASAAAPPGGFTEVAVPLDG